MKNSLSLLLCVVVLAGCSGKQAPVANSADRLAGQWLGPEGTYLHIAGAGGKYALTIRNLDGPRTFEGRGAGDAIQFKRDARPESIRATDGAGTGMKWLLDKKDCVVIQPGEGYCRD